MTPEPVDGLSGRPSRPGASPGRSLRRHHGESCQLKNFVPVTERGPRASVPPRFVSRSRTAPQAAQDDFQRDFSNQVGSPPEVVSVTADTTQTVHDCDDRSHGVDHSSIRPRKLSQSLMLITWLLEVSRSLKAAVNWGFFRNDPHSLKPRLDVMIVVFRRCRLCISVKN